jgi:asparagine synthase (glutamine-hydrolysing)
VSGFLVAPRHATSGAHEPAWSAMVTRIRDRGYSPTPVLIGADAPWVAMRWGHPNACRHAVSPDGALVLLGTARVDNVDEMRTTAGGGDRLHDADLILAAYARVGPDAIARLVGDFAFVLWDAGRGRLVAARDALGVKRLSWAPMGDGVVFSSTQFPLAATDALDDEYVYSYLTGAPRRATASIWRDVHAVAPGHYHIVERGRQDVQQYWAPGERPSVMPKGERDQVAELRALLKTAVGACLRAEGPVWAELSGGVDSASVYGLADELRAEGLRSQIAGTYSFVDDMAGANEDRFLSAVLSERPVRNERITTTAPFHDDGAAPPMTDEPRVYFVNWARDRHAERLVSGAGGSVILSGGGSDFYLTGTPTYLADLVRSLSVAAALRGAHEHATAYRTSTWKILWAYGLRPLYEGRDARLRRGQAIEWIDAARVAEVRAQQQDAPSDHVTHAAHHARRELRGAAQFFELPLTHPPVEKRYPFFDRRVIDFALGLDPRMLLRSGLTKWALREAIRGAVPEAVRTRRSKGYIDGRTLWALSHHEPLIARLVRGSILADAGWVDRARLEAAVARARSGLVVGSGPLIRVLSLEVWLRVQAGRWPEVAPFVGRVAPENGSPASLSTTTTGA